MTHLGDRLAEFFYKELSTAEMNEAQRHVDSCAECRHEISQFEKMHLSLRMIPELDPPRRIVFASRERVSWFSWFDWRSAVGATIAAVVVTFIVNLSFLRHTPVSEGDRVWVAAELEKRDQEIQRLQVQLAYYENFQRTVMKETLENGSAIQLLALRTRSRN
jgi:hypothetical protein